MRGVSVFLCWNVPESQGELAKVVRDVLALVFLSGNEGRVEEGPVIRGVELAVHLGVLG